MSVTHPRGFRAAGVVAGLKASGRPDLALVVNDGPDHHAAAVFTSNRVEAAPVTWSRQVVADGRADAVVLNSGGANACTGADRMQTAQIIDMPANYHNGAAGFSFSDGHAEIKSWKGSKIRNMPVYFGRKSISLNVPAGDSWVDVNWMADNTTVRR